MATKEQAVLLSLIENGLVPDWQVNFARSVATSRYLSQKQEFHVNKIIKSIVEPEIKAPAPKVDVAKIVQLFVGAKKHLKYPKVWLQTEKNKFDIRCSMAGDRSKYAGSINMAAGAFGSTWYGSIKPTGELWLSADGKRIEAELLALLTEFAADPAGTAMKHGKLTSHCCFCSLKLSTPESLAVGYGDTCASHWGLPWGDLKKSSATILKAVQADIAQAVATGAFGVIFGESQAALGPLSDDLIED